MSSFDNTNTPLYGAPAPKHTTGRYYPPPWCIAQSGDTLTATTTRFYMYPYLITEIRQYAGFMTTNAGTDDSGDTIRLGLYDQDGNLVVAGAEITLGSTAIDNESAGTFTPAYLGWHWLVAHFNGNPVMKRLLAQGAEVTAAGYRVSGILPAWFGTLTGALDDTASTAQPVCYYLDTAYAALPSTLPTPTSMTSIGPYVTVKA